MIIALLDHKQHWNELLEENRKCQLSWDEENEGSNKENLGGNQNESTKWSTSGLGTTTLIATSQDFFEDLIMDFGTGG